MREVIRCPRAIGVSKHIRAKKLGGGGQGELRGQYCKTFFGGNERLDDRNGDLTNKHHFQELLQVLMQISIYLPIASDPKRERD